MVLNFHCNAASAAIPIITIYSEERNAKRYDFLERRGAAI
ncbi:hypothetical protein MARI151_20309 [Maribacter litoralis]|uniref:Uncharacterized protein n=1 Tax=Maribacter litoralis TaxID=2059726 RepID=A0A653PPE3_9FLAO|nr:hypothetical protein MARI151_20309 [Maribacter litoralis]